MRHDDLTQAQLSLLSRVCHAKDGERVPEREFWPQTVANLLRRGYIRKAEGGYLEATYTGRHVRAGYR